MRNPEFEEKHPELAEEVTSLMSRFERGYNLQNVEDQATFAEAMQQFGAHIARNSKTGSISVGVGPNGVVNVTATSTPSAG